MANEKLISQRQHKMIDALMKSRNIGEACKVSGVSRSTLARWLKEPFFSNSLTAAGTESLKESERVLLAGQSEALKTIREVMKHGAPATRLKAANDWMTNLIRIREMGTLEERIRELEESYQKERITK